MGVVLAVLTVITYWRARGVSGWFTRSMLALIRLSVILGLTVVLMRPMRVEIENTPALKSVFQVLVDTSESMNTEDMDEKTRIAAVAQALEDSGQSFEELSDSFDVQYYRFDDALRSSTRKEILSMERADGDNTDIGESLLNVANTQSSRKRAGVLLVSDGRSERHASMDSASTYLKSANIPVWTTTVGTDTQAKDLFVTARFDQKFFFVDHETELKVNLGQSGYQGWYAKVDLSQNEKVIATRQVMLNSGVVQTSFPVEESKPGLYQYVVEVTPLKGESDVDNNRRAVFAQVVGERSSVLVIEAEPYWDSKFMLRTLQADPNLDVTSFFYMNKEKMFAITQSGGAGGKSSTPQRLPRTEEELFKYDCVILGRGVDHIFTSDEMKLFRKYVDERGGNLVFARGRSYSVEDEVLSDLEPLIWEEGNVLDARFGLTSSGLNNPMFDFSSVGNAKTIIRELPEMISISRVSDEKTLAVVLASGTSGRDGKEIAAIAYQRYGRGKVLSIGTAGLWRWAFSPKDVAKYDPVYAKFWGQMIRWLIYGSDFLPGQDVSFTTDRHSFDLGETVSLIIQTKNIDSKRYQPKITITAPDKSQSEFSPIADAKIAGLYHTTFFPEQTGEYTADLKNNVGAPETVEALFTVYDNSIEKRYIAADPDSMAKIAHATGGATLGLDDWKTLPELVKEFEYSTKEESKPFDVWDKMLVMFAFFSILGIEWFWRRMSGLV
jgi:hypothetical protein